MTINNLFILDFIFYFSADHSKLNAITVAIISLFQARVNFWRYAIGAALI